MALDTEKVIKKSSLSAERREAMLKGSAPDKGIDQGQSFLYRPADFVSQKDNGFERCYRVEGKERFPTAPEIHGYPFDVVQRDGTANTKDYEQIKILLLSDTFIMSGADGAKVEQVVKKGDVLLLTSTAGLDTVRTAAIRPTDVVEVWIRPVQKEPLPGRPGQTTWRWSVKMGQSTPRDGVGVPSFAGLPPELAE